MADPWDQIRDEATGVVKDALKGFVENNKEVDDFVKEKASQYAREFWLSRNAATEEERKEHTENLAHVQAQVRMEVDRLRIAISVDAKNTIIRILEAVGGVLIRIAPKILAAI